ncbi:MAG: hypothetical protein IJT02_08360 [Synergistaceae bacterium]|nr:hypothetical protein [Synergistaceae bacterium]
MSNIPKSKRSESKLEALHRAYELRRKITAELMATFGYSHKKLEAHVQKLTSYVTDPEEREKMSKAIRELEDGFDSWFIRRERDRVADFCQGITEHLRAANTIWPTYMAEFQERRLEMDRALVCCNKLQDELQYIAETLPADKNKFMNIVLEVQAVFDMIKALRQADNRFLKNIKQ